MSVQQYYGLACGLSERGEFSYERAEASRLSNAWPDVDKRGGTARTACTPFVFCTASAVTMGGP